jgi:hypothetical protein
LRANREQHDHALVYQASSHEKEQLGRLRIHPLQVVDNHDERGVVRDR